MKSVAIYRYLLIVTQYMMMRSKQQAASSKQQAASSNSLSFYSNHKNIHLLSMMMPCKADGLIIPIYLLRSTGVIEELFTNQPRYR